MTEHQQEICDEIDLSLMQNKKTLFSIQGRAGTGKTLLGYHIARELRRKGDQEVLVIHCGLLSDGHQELKKEYGWLIESAVHVNYEELSKYALIVVDEAQRMREHQIKELLKISKTGTKFLFLHDPAQVISKTEKLAKSSDLITQNEEICHFELTNTIRTNPGICIFVEMLLNKYKRIGSPEEAAQISQVEVEIYYFPCASEAKNQLELLSRRDSGCSFKAIELTPPVIDDKDASYVKYTGNSDVKTHNVIGQEFDGVATIIDEGFRYGKSGRLEYKADTFYDPERMLFQNLTRSRERLALIFSGSKEVLERSISILECAKNYKPQSPVGDFPEKSAV